MSKPAPIKIRGPGAIRIRLIGNIGLSYLSVDSIEKSEIYGFIEDRDVKRLAAWCKRCLAKKESKMKAVSKGKIRKPKDREDSNVGREFVWLAVDGLMLPKEARSLSTWLVRAADYIEARTKGKS